MRVFVWALAAITTSVPAARQPIVATSIPIHRLVIDAATKELLGLPYGLKQFADGRVIVNDVLKRRLVVFDSTLTNFTVTADAEGTGATLYPSSFGITDVFYYLGDSAVFPDMASQTFVMIEPNGKFGRAFAHPRPTDMSTFSQPLPGSPSFDAQGRFVYRAYHRGRPLAGDTVAIVRADFDTRAIDTIAQITVPTFSGPDITVDDKGHTTARILINPVPDAPDEWAVLSDGSLAIVRAHDYHIDWLYADGSHASSPKMPFDWRRLTDEDKRAKIDSVKHVVDSMATAGHPYGMMTTGPARGQTKRDTIVPTITFVPLSDMLDYVPPIRAGAVRADRDNHLWILPSTTLSATGGGLLYDVVSKQGEIIERVQLPRDRAIAGFGPRGAVYLRSGEPSKGLTLERAHVVR